MKKLSVLILALVCLLAFTGCCFHSEWYAATCTAPKTCAECGETEGEALGHTWTDATCTTAKTCTTCNLTEGEALGHTWVDATTEAPKTCTTCAETEGERIVTDERFTTASTIDLQGKWEAEMSASAEDMGLDMEGFEGELALRISMDLGNDGTMTMGFTTVNNDEFCDAMSAFMLNAMYAEFEAQGVSKEDGDAAMVEYYGMTTEEYVEAIMAEMDFSAYFESMSMKGVYYVANGQLYTGIGWGLQMEGTDYTLDGDTLVLTDDLSGLGDDALVFTRVTE